MVKSLKYAIIFLSLYSCGSYTLSTNKGYEVKSILAVTEVGDTIAVPYRQFVKYRDTQFVRYQHNNSWYWNNWRYNDHTTIGTNLDIGTTMIGGIVIIAILLAHMLDRKLNRNLNLDQELHQKYYQSPKGKELE